MTYQAKKNWGPDDPVMETDYNRIETGIEDAHQLIKDLANELGGSFVVSGLTFNYSGLTATWAAGVAYVKGQRFSVPAGSIALNANQGQYIYLDTDGAIKKSTSQAVADGVCPLWYFTTNATTVLSYADRRNILNETLTVDQAQVPSSNTAKWPKFLSFFANRFKAITGETDWKTDPVKTIKQLWTDLSNHLSSTNNPHNVTSKQVNRLALNAFTESAPMSDYPDGVSVFYAQGSVNSWLGKTTSSFCVETYKTASPSWGVQRVTVHDGSSTSEVWQRAVGSNTNGAVWGPWVRVDPSDVTTFATIAVKNNAGTSKGSVAADSKQDTATLREGTAILMTADSATDEITISVDTTQFAPAAHVGTGGAAHAVATSSASGFMSAADYTKLQGIQAGAEVNQNASGFWSDTTTQVAANTTYTKTIPIGFAGKKGRLVIRHGSSSTWATVYFNTDSTKATSVEVTSTPTSQFYSKALGDARLGSRNTYISEGVNASATGLTEVYISGSNLIIVFRNGSTSTATLSVGACYWEVEG